MSASTPAIDCRTSVLPLRGRLVVCCEIEHFISSGLTVQELLARLRPQLAAAIEDAAARDPDSAGKPRAPSAGIDVGTPDPGITLWIYNPRAEVGDLDDCLRRLEIIVTRFVAMPPPGCSND